jgi:ornithine carbamoyltransferase
MLKTKSLLSVSDLSVGEIEKLISHAITMKQKKSMPQALKGKNIALLFEKPSLRTRVSFEIAVQQLGGYCLYLSPSEVGLGKREPVADVARVLRRYLDGIVARTFAHQTLLTLAQYADIPVINALSDFEHPCQALADIMTIYEKKGKLRGLELVYIGDGNNVAHSLCLAAILAGLNFIIATPEGYEMNEQVIKKAKEISSRTGSKLIITTKPNEAAVGADVIYTDVWTSMGQEAEAEQRRSAFALFQITEKILSCAKKDVVFMHPLPAHQGEEIAEGLLDHPSSVVFDQAENRLHIQRALLAELFQAC